MLQNILQFGNVLCMVIDITWERHGQLDHPSISCVAMWWWLGCLLKPVEWYWLIHWARFGFCFWIGITWYFISFVKTDQSLISFIISFHHSCVSSILHWESLWNLASSMWRWIWTHYPCLIGNIAHYNSSRKEKCWGAQQIGQHMWKTMFQV